jgi:hypothetical protein
VKTVLFILCFSSSFLVRTGFSQILNTRGSVMKSEPDVFPIDGEYFKERGLKPNRENDEKSPQEDVNLYRGWFLGYVGNWGNAPVGLTFGYLSSGVGFYFYYVTATKDFTEKNFYGNISESKAKV